jgi:hypothetical protein
MEDTYTGNSAEPIRQQIHAELLRLLAELHAQVERKVNK